MRARTQIVLQLKIDLRRQLHESARIHGPDLAKAAGFHIVVDARKWTSRIAELGVVKNVEPLEPELDILRLMVWSDIDVLFNG